ncbi:hypothetical protein GCM10011390_03340 [Aureimonas endophytica]|uniref:Uncharacterized protein n=1 Tax=Aureimonas endophytica TaxID=2027858 RepID=A0A916ZD53_9HYPH|nr:hypothetical protein [Aureimonas endophytica]GGD87909.1 hypothetical protein GCM10011390_03340 [Aureimonas endophytica]
MPPDTTKPSAVDLARVPAILLRRRMSDTSRVYALGQLQEL